MKILSSKINKKIIIVALLAILVLALFIFLKFRKDVYYAPPGCTTKTSTSRDACKLNSITTETCCGSLINIEPQVTPDQETKIAEAEESFLAKKIISKGVGNFFRSLISTITGKAIEGDPTTNGCTTRTISSTSVCSPRGDIGVCCSCDGGTCGGPGAENCCTQENNLQSCQDGWDNDCDGLTDSEDPDCCSSDGDPCTFEFVENGFCQVVPIPNCLRCESEGECDDHNPNTLNLCVSGRCLFQQG